MGFIRFGRKAFGRKGMAPVQLETRSSGRIFGNRSSRDSRGESPFDRFYAHAEEIASRHVNMRPSAACYEVLSAWTPEEKGELLADLPSQPGVFDRYTNDAGPREVLARAVEDSIWNQEVEIRKEHLAPLLRLLLDNPSFRKNSWALHKFDAIYKWIASAIAQGAFLTSGDCEDLAELAQAMRSQRTRYRNADQKRMISRAEKIEKLAGVEVSATEFLLQRCEGAENKFAIADKPRPNAQFWADVLAEVAATLNEIRLATKGSGKPEWSRKAAAFESHWPACGEVRPSFETWQKGGRPVPMLKEHNGKRNGWADPEDYRKLPETIAGATAHSRYNWTSEHIPGLDVLGDLENPDWTALVEHLITQRRATKATKKWQKKALALCEPIGLVSVEARLHDWLALFHSPALGRKNYTSVANGERFAGTLDRLEEAHPEWPERHAQETASLGRAVAIVVASGGDHGLCRDFHPELVRCDDYSYKNKTTTDGVLHLLKAEYNNADGQTIYQALSSWMRLSVENEEFVRGALWLVALMPDRARAIKALELTAQSAATYLSLGEEGMRSKIIANAAIATLIDLGGGDIDAAVLRLSKQVEHRTVQAPLLNYLNAED